MKNLIGLFIIALLLGLSTASAIATDITDEAKDDVSTNISIDTYENEDEEVKIMDIKKEFMVKINKLKEEFKDRMDDEDSRKKYLEAKNELYLEYKPKLADTTKIKRENYKAKREELRGKFRDSFNKNERLKSRINNISDDRLGKLLGVIDRLILKTEENTKLSDERINSKIATYNALRDLIEAELANSEEDLIEGLLK